MSTRIRLIALAAAAAALVLPTTASAKGPSAASITGPGLSSPLVIKGDEGGDYGSLGVMVEQTGFFPQAFGQSPDPTLRAAPKRLGSRFSVVYTVPNGSPDSDTLRQDLYPYAIGGPVSYMAPGQKFWGGQQVTHGGWFRASAYGYGNLRAALVKAGLPKRDPALAHRHAADRTGMTVAVGTGAGLVLAAAALMLLRRRQR